MSLPSPNPSHFSLEKVLSSLKLKLKLETHENFSFQGIFLSCFHGTWYFFLLCHWSHCSIQFFSSIIHWYIPQCQGGCLIIFWFPHSAEIWAYSRRSVSVGWINTSGYLIFFFVWSISIGWEPLWVQPPKHPIFNQCSLTNCVSQVKMSSWIMAFKKTFLYCNEVTGWDRSFGGSTWRLLCYCEQITELSRSWFAHLLSGGLFLECKRMTDFLNIWVENYHRVYRISFFTKVWIICSSPPPPKKGVTETEGK